MRLALETLDHLVLKIEILTVFFTSFGSFEKIFYFCLQIAYKKRNVLSTVTKDSLWLKTLDEFDISIFNWPNIDYLKEITRAILKMSEISMEEILSFEGSLLQTSRTFELWPKFVQNCDIQLSVMKGSLE